MMILPMIFIIDSVRLLLQRVGGLRNNNRTQSKLNPPHLAAFVIHHGVGGSVW